ncbi:MAG TPA: hypothetical protein VLV28_02805 [Gaiellaceae bacterium]|nr:hypothetical protein [Gaiellaceae bacterium]
MTPPRGNRRVARPKRPRREIRRRRVALLVVVLTIVTVTLLVTAFGGGDHPAPALTAPASASRLLPAGPPAFEPLAKVGALTIELPVNQSRITAIGYYAADDGALGLTPLGTQANQGLLKRLAHAIFGGGSGSPHWYLLPGGTGPSTSALDVGAPPGTDVYAPVSGTIVGIEKVILDGAVHGQRVDIQPTSAPSLVVSVENMAVDPSLSVGSSVTQGSSKLGELIDLSKLERQSLARYTNDAGNHVLIEVHPAATLALG